MAFIYTLSFKTLLSITTIKTLFIVCLLWCTNLTAQMQVAQSVKLIPVDGSAWANNSVNVTVFRKNSLVTHGDTQFIAYYNKDAHVVVGKRKLGNSKMAASANTLQRQCSRCAQRYQHYDRWRRIYASCLGSS